MDDNNVGEFYNITSQLVRSLNVNVCIYIHVLYFQH